MDSTRAEDWTTKDWPGQKFVAGLSDKVRDLVVGSEFKNFDFEAWRDVICPFMKLPQVNMVFWQCDGNRMLHHPHTNLSLSRLDESRADAERCIALNPSWEKDYYRLGRALEALMHCSKILEVKLAAK